jgi:hypothetical protein
VHVTRPILDPQNVAGLRDMREQRVVAAIFPVVGIEAAEGPGDGGAGAHDGAVDIEREPGDVQPRHCVEHEVLIEPHQGAQRLLREAPEPVTHGARRRHAGQASKAAHERIPDQILQVLQPARANVRQREEQQRQARAAVIPTEGGARGMQMARQIDPLQIPSHQLQSTVRRELLGNERDRQIPLDHLPQRAYAQTHQRGLHESRDGMGISTLLIRGIAPLMHFGPSLLPSVFTD